jgi:hypothetical protein
MGARSLTHAASVLSGRRERGLVPAALALIVLGAAALSPARVPFNMDEFAAYHPLGCRAFPLSGSLHTYREACGLYDLRPPGAPGFLPLRSYRYIGSLPVAVYYPFWKMVPRPVSARLHGAVLLLVSLALTCRLLRVPWWAAALGALVFPVYAVAFVADTGPSGLSIVLLLAALAALQRAQSGDRAAMRAVWAAAAGLAVFLGAWVKPVFLWTAPALALAWFVPPWPRSGRATAAYRGERLWLAACAAVAFGLPAAVLAASVDRWGARYVEVVRVGRVTLAPDSAAVVAGRLMPFLLDGAAILPRTLALPASALDVLPPLLAATLAVAALAFAPESRRGVLSALAMAGLVFAVTLSAGRAWAPHHAVFTLAFLALALALAAEALARTRPMIVSAAAVLAAVFWCSVVVRLPAARFSPDTNRAKDELLLTVRRDGLTARTVQVHVSWGTYYIAHLFGAKDQAVVFLDRYSARPETYRRLKRAARDLGRTVLVIGSDEGAELGPEQIARFGAFVAERRVGNWWAREYAP